MDKETIAEFMLLIRGNCEILYSLSKMHLDKFSADERKRFSDFIDEQNKIFESLQKKISE